MNYKLFIGGDFTTIMRVGASRGRELNTLLGNYYPKECFVFNERSK
jgi:hypothetical protein